MRQHDTRNAVDQGIDILLLHQFALLFHQAQLQHLGLDLDVRGVGFRPRRARQAQMLDVAQPRNLSHAVRDAVNDQRGNMFLNKTLA